MMTGIEILRREIEMYRRLVLTDQRCEQLTGDLAQTMYGWSDCGSAEAAEQIVHTIVFALAMGNGDHDEDPLEMLAKLVRSARLEHSAEMLEAALPYEESTTAQGE